MTLLVLNLRCKICFFFQDYRGEALKSLRDAGKTEEQIEQWFPKSVREKRKEQLDNYNLLKDEVQELKKRLELLEEHVQLPNRSALVENHPTP